MNLTKITERILQDYPDTQAILLRGSFARGDGVDVQDIDLTVITSQPPTQEEVHIFKNGTFYDIAFVAESALTDTEALLCNPYLAGAYAEAQILFDAGGNMKQYLSDFREKFPQQKYLSKRVAALLKNLESQYNDVLSALDSGDPIDVHCRFATYTWTLCDAVNVKSLQSPSWIRGLHKVGRVDKAMMNRIINAEYHRHLDKDALLRLLNIYSELWQGEFWDFLKSEIEWLILNISEPIGFHPLNICFMMGIENRKDKAGYFEQWQQIIGSQNILPMRSIDGFKRFHEMVIEYLNLDCLWLRQYVIIHSNLRSGATQ